MLFQWDMNMPLVIALFVVGLLVGVVVNWLADQLPLLHSDEDDDAAEGETGQAVKKLNLSSLHRPVCVRCGAPRPILAYSGLTAWISGKRRCEQCGHTMSVRYPIVELLLGVMFVYLFSQHGMSVSWLALIFYMSLFVLIAVIDIEYRYVLNIVMLPAFVIALIEIAASGRLRLRDGLVGYAVGQLAVMVIYLFGGLYLWVINRDREDKITEVPFGFGDVTLATFCGLIVGYPDVVYMLVLMVVVGGAIALGYAIYYMVFARKYGGYVPFAYGPAILLAATVTLLWPTAMTSYIYGPH